jgi:hypothetical protein
VPLTLTAVHHLRTEDTGIGSGVLNTMQQVGGALGLSILGTVATHVMTDTSGELQSAGAASGGAQPSAEQLHIVGLQVFAHGSTVAFLVGSAMILTASAIVWLFLSVKHDELATDGPEGVPAVH